MATLETDFVPVHEDDGIEVRLKKLFFGAFSLNVPQNIFRSRSSFVDWFVELSFEDDSLHEWQHYV